MRKAAVSLVLLAGCMVGPNYERPEVSFSEEFLEEEDQRGKEVDLRSWWTQFNDPILNEMIAEAIEGNLDLMIAAQRIEEMRAQYQLAAANLMPEIDFNSYGERQRLTQNLTYSTFLGPPIQNLYWASLDASWEIDLFGHLRRLKEAAVDTFQAAQENFRGVYITLLADVARLYTDFRSFQALITLTIEQIKTLEDLLMLSKVRYKAGLKAELEPLQSKAELDSLKASLPPLEAMMRQSLYGIAVLLGKQPETIPDHWMAPKPILKANGKIPVGLPSDLLRRRPDIRQAERQLAAATAQVGAAVAELFPTFSLTGTFGYESVKAHNWFTFGSEFWSIAPNVFWPVIDFGRIRDQIDIQNALQKEALYVYEQTILKALEEVEDALVAYYKEEMRLHSLQDTVCDLKRFRDLTKDLYRAGLNSLTDLLNAERQVLEAEETLVASEQTLSEDLMAVYKSLGGDWACSCTP